MEPVMDLGFGSIDSPLCTHHQSRLRHRPDREWVQSSTTKILVLQLQNRTEGERRKGPVQVTASAPEGPIALVRNLRSDKSENLLPTSDKTPSQWQHQSDCREARLAACGASLPCCLVVRSRQAGARESSVMAALPFLIHGWCGRLYKP